jgi:hypothetical protein
MFSGRNQVDPQASRDCAKDLYAQAGITNPREQIDVAELYVPFSWFEPMWLESLGFCALERWLAPDARGRDRARRRSADQSVGRRPLVESDRRLGAHSLRRGRAAGSRPRRRAPSRGRQSGDGPRLRRRLAILRHVDRRQRAARMNLPQSYNLADLFESGRRGARSRGAHRRDRCASPIASSTSDRRASPTTCAAAASRPGSTSGSTSTTAPSISKACWRRSSSARCRSTSTIATSRASCASLPQRRPRRALHQPELAPRVDAIEGELPLLKLRLAVGADYEAALASASPRATSRAARATTSTSSTPAARPGCRAA